MATNGNAWVSLHPHGRQSAFSAGQTNNEVWVMEKFLPEGREVR